MAPRLLIREDPDASEIVTRRFRDEGIAVLLEHRAKQFAVENGEKVLIAAHTAAQDEKLSNIQQLLTEQRSDIKELLKEAKSR
jgi:pyruvate/2-oxoglutarate dehydrogenase complex dihydrolipoamide dehydrogenase (E3) component